MKRTREEGKRSRKEESDENKIRRKKKLEKEVSDEKNKRREKGE